MNFVLYVWAIYLLILTVAILAQDIIRSFVHSFVRSSVRPSVLPQWPQAATPASTWLRLLRQFKRLRLHRQRPRRSLLTPSPRWLRCSLRLQHWQQQRQHPSRQQHRSQRQQHPSRQQHRSQWQWHPSLLRHQLQCAWGRGAAAAPQRTRRSALLAAHGATARCATSSLTPRSSQTETTGLTSVSPVVSGWRGTRGPRGLWCWRGGWFPWFPTTRGGRESGAFLKLQPGSNVTKTRCLQWGVLVSSLQDPGCSNFPRLVL